MRGLGTVSREPRGGTLGRSGGSGFELIPPGGATWFQLCPDVCVQK